MIISVPTGGGKSLISDILVLRRLTERSDDDIISNPAPKAMYVLPYISLITEKMLKLTDLFEEAPFTLCGLYTGSDCNNNQYIYIYRPNINRRRYIHLHN